MRQSRMWCASALVALATLNAPAGVDAQAPERQAQGVRPNAGRGGRGPQTPPANANVQQVEQYLDAYMVMQARQVLELADDQFFVVAPRLERLQVLRRRLQRERQRVTQELAEILRNPGPVEEAVVAPKIKFLDDQLVSSADEMKKAYAEIDQILTPRQRAQFRVLEMRLERQRQDLMAAARAQGRGGQNPPGPQNPPPADPQAAGAGS
ncbi:MAG TPA: hypothetical protein VFV98_05055 [Vicinamibacterales bacterium]|nr:hypothetical protein [Vicinamibacterales bacterium]